MNHDNPRAWLALDVGGANIKAAHSAGLARSVPFALWKRPEVLPSVLRALAATFPRFDNLAVTMTAELCDCYATKSEGVAEVLGAVLALAPLESIHVWGIDGQFHSPIEVFASPRICAAANWLALARVAGRSVSSGPALLIDVGSTTTDLIPLSDGIPTPTGRTDTERLRTGELIYVGVRRTPVCAVAPELTWRGASTGLAAELFATTLDIYLTLGHIRSDFSDTNTADGRPATVEAARGRLARMVGADRDDFSVQDAIELARAADLSLQARLAGAAVRVCSAMGSPRSTVIAGAGSFLARCVAKHVVGRDGLIVELSESWDQEASAAACARALLVLAQEEGR